MAGTVSVVLPVYNEAEVIESVVRDYHKTIIKKLKGSKLVVVEDGSTDGTKEILRRLRKELKFDLHTGEKRKGYFLALADALRIPKTDIVFFSDTDRQHRSRDFWKLYRNIDKADIISGRRVSRKDAARRIFLSRVYNRILGVTFGLNVNDSNSGFKMMKRHVIEDVIKDMKHIKYGFSSEFLIRSQKRNHKILEVPISHIGRKTGKETQFELKKLPKAVSAQLSGIAKLRLELWGLM